MIESISQWICRRFHKAIMLPLNGHYICRKCLRVYETGYR